MSTYGAPELVNAFRVVRKNTLQIADDIPESQYDFVAAPGCRSVAGLLKHIAFAATIYYDMHRDRRITTLKGYDFGALTARTDAAEQQPMSKAEIIALLRAEGDQFAEWLQSLPQAFLAETFTDPTGQNPKSRLEHLMGAKEHEMHHRGQLMLIERLLGVVPHLTREREARIAARRAAAAAATAATSGAR